MVKLASKPARAAKRASRSGRPLSLLFLDLGGFKGINDTHGHLAGSRALVEAASTMGADDRTVLKTVVLPLILPYLVSGYAFAFVLSLNEYIDAYMTVGFTMETLPIKIFNALRYGYTPTMASVSVFFVAVAAVVFGLIAAFGDIRKLLGAMSSER